MRAFLIWLFAPFLFYLIVIPGLLLLFRHDVALAPMFHWKNLAYVFAFCATPAVFGSISIFLLPIRRALLGIIAGVIFAFAGVMLCAWLEMSFFGGFEANVGIYVTAVMILLPTCLAGAYIGLLRSKEERAT
jgi:hypothetical protein